MLFETISTNYAKAHPTNQTDLSFASKVPTVTEPTGTGVINLGKDGGLTANQLILQPFGAGADNTTFDMQVIGWRPIGDLWIPTQLGKFNCTLCAAVGVAGQSLVATDRLADTIVLASDTASLNTSIEVCSPLLDMPGHIVIDCKGAKKAEIIFDMTGATNGNCLVGLL